MKARLLVLTILALACTAAINSLSAAEDNKPCYRDYEAVEQFINSKRVINFAEKDKMLRISGDIRATYLDRCETQGKKALRGHGSTGFDGLPIPHKTYEAVINIRFDYKNGTKTWAAAYMALDNPMGISCAERKCPPKVVPEEETVKRGCSNGGAVQLQPKYLRRLSTSMPLVERANAMTCASSAAMQGSISTTAKG